MIPSIETQEEVMFFDTDCGGVVHNIAYLRWIETARTKLAADMGMSLAEMAKSQMFPVVVRTEIDYRKPATLGDVVRVSAVLESIDRVRFWMALEVLRAEDETLLITCRQQLAMVQMPEGKPLRLPEEWAEKWPEIQKKSKKLQH